MRMRRAGALLALLLATACGGDAGPNDMSGAWQVDSTATIEIGALEGDSVYQLYRVRGVAELPDGGIAIANAGTSEIRIYDAGGTHLRSVGRAGDGPGEFRWLGDLHTRGDTLFAFDRRAARLTRFHALGEHLGDVTLRAAVGRFPALAGILPDGGIVVWLSAPAADRDGFVRDSALLLRIADDGLRTDTLGVFPGREAQFETEGRQGNIVSVSIMTLDHYRDFMATVANGRVYAAPTDSAVLHAIAQGTGTATERVTWEDLPRPVDDAYLDAYTDEQFPAESAAARVRMRSMLRDAGRPPTRPVFDALLAGPHGEVWVRRFPEPGAADAEWLVFDAPGAPVGRVRLPRDHELLWVGRERIYTLEQDEYDVEYVRGYALRRVPD